MLSALRWLALEVKYLDRARPIYEDQLDLPIRRQSETEVAFGVGSDELILRAPSSVPRGGLHTHFAFATPAEEYDRWWNRLDRHYDLIEHRFGAARSLYFHDPDDHCVEIGQFAESGSGLTAVFEVVLEVEDLDRATRFYRRLGFDPVDRGSKRRRIRLTGPMDLELWEPQLGLADARGGVHVDLGFDCRDVARLVESIESEVQSVESLEHGARVKDRDGHYLTFLAE